MPLLFGPLGLPEILLVVLILVLIFGAKKLPHIGAGLGKGIRNFKESVTGKEEKPLEPGEDKEP